MFGSKKMKCPICGASVDKDVKYCPACGKMLNQGGMPLSPSPAPKPKSGSAPKSESGSAPKSESGSAPRPVSAPAVLPAEKERVFFGRYRGDDLEWVVLETEGDRALLFCACSIEILSYHNKPISVSWARSDMRKWLNGKFFKTAFTKEEQKRICTVTLKNPGHLGAMGGSDTQDNVFLLSVPEIDDYRYAIPQNFDLSNDVNNRRKNISVNGYWLRTPAGGKAGCQAIIAPLYGGRESRVEVAPVDHNNDADKKWRDSGLYSMIGVRPAIWVKF